MRMISMIIYITILRVKLCLLKILLQPKVFINMKRVFNGKDCQEKNDFFFQTFCSQDSLWLPLFSAQNFTVSPKYGKSVCNLCGGFAQNAQQS